ncbi:hypothetical protein [Melissospora conviva]|uniref:hypothetical protein n=1 Tax=Melissospora conviva TaxID=3388432 RepID=UPI003C26FE39
MLMVVAGLMDAALFLTCLGVVMSVRQWRRQAGRPNDPAGERDDDLYRQVVEEMDHPNRLADRIVQVVAEFGPAGVCRPTIRGRVLAPGEPHGKLYVALVGALESGLIELVPGSAPEGRYRLPVA